MSGATDKDWRPCAPSSTHPYAAASLLWRSESPEARGIGHSVFARRTCQHSLDGRGALPASPRAARNPPRAQIHGSRGGVHRSGMRDARSAAACPGPSPAGGASCPGGDRERGQTGLAGADAHAAACGTVTVGARSALVSDAQRVAGKPSSTTADASSEAETALRPWPAAVDRSRPPSRNPGGPRAMSPSCGSEADPASRAAARLAGDGLAESLLGIHKSSRLERDHPAEAPG